MKQLLLTLVLSLALFSCKFFDKAPAPTPTPAQMSVLTTGKVLENEKPSDSEFQLYRLLASNPENVNFSPLSLKIAFSLVYPGTDGSTQKLFEKIFGFKDDVSNPYAKEYDLVSRLKGSKSSDTTLVIANSAWAKNPKEVLSEYKDTLKIQNAELEKIGLDPMNEWVDDATHHQIPKLFEKISPDLQFVIVNAIYFKQKWVSVFDPKKTVVSPFEASPNLSVKVPTMNDKKKVRYAEDDVSKWIELHYENSPMTMLLALPKKRFDLRAVNEKLSTDYLSGITSKLKDADVTIALPKFKFANQGSMRELMSNAGYGDLFTKGNYDKISKTKLVLSDVIQATTIEVDESGTEAAAATAVAMMGAGAPEPLLSKSFLANEPFLFILRNDETKEIYWIGRVYQPLTVKPVQPKFVN